MSPLVGIIDSAKSGNLMPPGYVWLATATGNGSGYTTISSIPTEYDYLEIRCTIHSATNGSDASIFVNNDTSAAYTFHQMYMVNNDASVNGSSYNSSPNTDWNPANIPSQTYSSDIMATMVMQISNSAGKYKMYQARQGWCNQVGSSPMDGYYIVRSGQFASTSKISSLSIGSNGSANKGLTTISKVDLYGIKA